MSRRSSKKLLYQQARFPIFQNRMYDTEEEAKCCPTGDIRLVEDQETGLVYNASFRPELMVYDANYQNEQACSPLFALHLDAVATIVRRCMGTEDIVEVGCGKGYFLELLITKGFKVTGFDPTYEGSNPRVIKRYFEPGVGIQISGLVLRHVLEHIPNPFEFLKQLTAASGGTSKIYIEVPCFDWICKNRTWFDVFYEHVNYFRISDFYRLFDSVIESGHLFGGQYLYVVADLSSIKSPVREEHDAVSFPPDFTEQSISLTHTEGEPTTIWGGASKGVIFALLKARYGQPVSTVIDINPAKQGKFLPSTGLVVQSPDQALPSLAKGSTIYVMNSNYMDEIRQMTNHAFNYIGIDHE